jgi:hypothetical protein
MRLAIITTMIFSSTTALPASSDNSTTDSRPRLLECPNPPVGVIRFALPSSDGRPLLFEWSGKTIRKVDPELYGKDFYAQFKAGSTYKWNYWELNTPLIDRQAAGAKSFLSTPYSMSSDGRLLAAGLLTENEQQDIAPKSFVLLDVSAKTVMTSVNVGQSIDALSWDPRAMALVIVSRVERYRKKTVKEQFAAAIGHPIPYEDIALTVFGLDGIPRCSTIAAQSLPYGTGQVRWDAN